MIETKYGLPAEVKFCTRCVISNQRPNSAVEHNHTANTKKTTISFDSEGVCDACRVAEKKKSIDWANREWELHHLCNEYRRYDGSYDCIVPGSGGKDSFYAAHVLKYKYGMHPLTVTWAPHMYTPWGWDNFQNWIHSGFDNQLVTPNGKVHRLLTRLAVDNLFHPFQPFILGQKNLAPKLAALHGIDLIFYGENEAEYGNPAKDASDPLRDNIYFSGKWDEVFLGGVPVGQLLKDYKLEMIDLIPYFPARPETVKNINVHYLGYYLKWHPQGAYYYATENSDFKCAPERTPGTYSKYNSLDDKIDDFHYYTTYIKFGIGRATYDAAQEIRSGDITREEGVKLVHKYDGEWPARFADDVFKYLSVDGFEPMTMEYFTKLRDSFKSPHLWDGDKLRHVVSDIFHHESDAPGFDGTGSAFNL